MSTINDRPGPEDQAHEIAEMRRELDEIRQNTSRSQTDQLVRIANRALLVVLPIFLTVAIQVINDLIDTSEENKQQLRIIHETRFSARDGAAMRAELLEAFSTRFPPPWLTESISRIETATSRVAERLTVLEQRLAAMEGKLQERKDGR